ncbi:MAG TPA: hypothetical protein ENH10_08980, partial [Bacteroidetes bacterium]|nr:hypothetical protein [Bacteroidota bacterium]HEX05268.1 hypothetical protein [Bacteroidota bacterium]
MKHLLIVLLMIGVLTSSAFAAHIVIIESTSFDPTHLMDQNWANVATGMGHTFSLLPQTALDNNAFFAICDLLIVSSGVIPLSATRRNIIRQAYSAGIPIYLQTEYDITYDTNQTWVDLVQDAAGTFSWNGNTTGILEPMWVTGTVSMNPNAVNQLLAFRDGAYGTGSREVETNLHFGDQEYGWYVRPLVTGAVNLAATSSDQYWVKMLTNPPLMENYIRNLLSYNATEVQIRCWHNGPPIVIPNTGGTFSAQTKIGNTGWTAQTFAAWTQVELPNNNIFGPFLYFPSVTVPPNSTTPTYTISQNVPAWAPPGTYYFHTAIGSFGNFILNLDSIQFTKLVVATD